MKSTDIAILGAGSWGTAVGIHLAKYGHNVLLWGRDSTAINEMKAQRCNVRYLPNITFPDTLEPTADLHKCVKSTHIMIAAPSHAFVQLLQQIPKPKNGISWLTKGLDPTTHKFLSDCITDMWGENYPMAAISGPSFAKEVASGLPTAIVVASKQPPYRKIICDLLHHQNIRVYPSNDLIGVQLGGAVKNVLAIACGISDGLHFGANAKAALITRGLAEISRLSVALHAQPETCNGLAGLGDLVLTCTDDQSRNRRFGLALGAGASATDALLQIGQVVEGQDNAAQVCLLATQHNVDMPICAAVNAVLQGKLSTTDAVNSLMQRPVVQMT